MQSVRIMLLVQYLGLLGGCSFARIVLDESDLPTITSVVGDSTVEPGAVANGLVISGANLQTVTRARLLEPSPGTGVFELEITSFDPFTVSLASVNPALEPSRDAYSLELQNSAGSVAIPLRLLRGASGPRGATGEPGNPGTKGTDAPQTDDACTPPQIVRGISPLGALVCATFTGLVIPTDGVSRPHRNYAIQPSDFRPLGAVSWAYDGLAVFRDSSPNQATELIAAVRLPQGATIVDYACRYVDNDNGNDLTVQLRRKLGAGEALCGTALTTSGAMIGAQVITGTPGSCNGAVAHDGSSGPDGVYAIVIGTAATTNLIELQGCSVRFATASGLP